KLQKIKLACVLSVLSLVASVSINALADEPGAETSSAASNTRYGLFDALDHRSWYNEGDYPEPFLVDDSGLEINEARLDWLHTTAGSQHNNTVTAEVEKGFGLLT